MRGSEFIGFAVGIQEGAREGRGDHRRAKRDGTGRQFVHEGIFRAAYGQPVEPGKRQKFRRIVASAMGR